MIVAAFGVSLTFYWEQNFFFEGCIIKSQNISCSDAPEAKSEFLENKHM